MKAATDGGMDSFAGSFGIVVIPRVARCSIWPMLSVLPEVLDVTLGQPGEVRRGPGGRRRDGVTSGCRAAVARSGMDGIRDVHSWAWRGVIARGGVQPHASHTDAVQPPVPRQASCRRSAGERQ